MTNRPPFQILERSTSVTTLGLRFWDEVTGSAVADGLRVIAYRPSVPERTFAAFPNHIGVFVVNGLPNLRDFENGSGDTDFWAYWEQGAHQYSLVVEVADEWGRFLPFAFEAKVPHKSVYDLNCVNPIVSPPEPRLPRVPLYSAPARSVPSGMAALYATLYTQPNGQPAPFAWLEARHDGVLLASGIADEQGRVLLTFAYPEITDSVFGSPLSGSVPLLKQTWVLDLRAGYASGVVSFSGNGKPLLCSVLNQPKGLLDVSSVTLSYGRPLIVRSVAAGKPLPVVWIAPTP